MSDACEHGFTYGMCPHGCVPTTRAEEPLPQEPIIHPNIIGEGLPLPEPYTDKLRCVICGQEVDRGVVYKGKPLCGNCMKDLTGKREKEIPGTVGGYPYELEGVGMVCVKHKVRHGTDGKCPKCEEEKGEG